MYAIVFTWIRPVLALTLLVPGTTPANITQSLSGTPVPADKGRLLFVEADRRNSGYRDMQVSLQMVLVSPRGGRTERSLRIQQVETQDDGDKVLVVFDLPASIRGTALLSYAHLQAVDDQWLFLPALKRIKKIASRNKTGSFVGSEFAFEDLSPQEVEKYDYEYVGEGEANGEAAYIVDRMPLDRFSGYNRQRVWLDQVHLRVLRIDYFDRLDNNSKQLSVGGYKLYADVFWKPSFMKMINLRTQKSTELYWQDYMFQTGLSEDRDFSVNSLRRVR